MKAVMRELAQAKQHYPRLPLFEFLRCETIEPRNRLAFVPCIAPFILAFSDLKRFVLRDESSSDPRQLLVNERTREDDRGDRPCDAWQGPPHPRGHCVTDLERTRCLNLSFRVLDLFADWSAELLAYAKNSSATRTIPHLVHGRTA